MNILVQHPKTKNKKIKFTLAEGLNSSIEKSKDLLEEFNRFEIEYLQMDFNKSLPMKYGIFDIVICTEVIEHIRNPNNFLKEIFRTQKMTLTLFLQPITHLTYCKKLKDSHYF